MGKILLNTRGAATPKESLHALENFAGRPRRVHFPSQFAAVPDPKREPAGKLLHFAYGVGQFGSNQLSVVSGK